ncbi:MAG: polymer-forming cytoskeletal protein [Candidatus Hydrogenedens sp.]|nr:polymer-forming cytoskeletal protein [Candidatus Hydrogenedens sp.]
MTALGAGATLKGALHCTGPVRIEGQVDGSIQSQSTVLLLEGAKVKGDLKGVQVIVSGEIRGNLYASDRVELQPAGKLQGNINAPRVCIHEGAFFQGECLMTKKEVAPPADTPVMKQTEIPTTPKKEDKPKVEEKVVAKKDPVEKAAVGKKNNDRRNRK